MGIRVKLCGIRRREDVLYLNEAMPDFAGFIFAPTRRYISPSDASELAKGLDRNIKKVGVFVNAPLEEMHLYTDFLDVYQLHGEEDEEYIQALRKIIPPSCEIWKAVRVRSSEQIEKADKLSCEKLLIDAFVPDEYGGTGKRADWSLIKGAKFDKPFFVAGGIDKNNIDEAVSELSPYGIDISSSIETDGVKDREKIIDIMETAEKYR